MNGKAFFDTNILVYAMFHNSKTPMADEVISRGGIISVQVLNEFANVCRRKLKLEWSIIDERLGVVREILPEAIPLTFDDHAKAVLLARDHGFMIYDALLIASALHAGCGRLITEDMQHDRDIEGLMIFNPFAH